MPDSLTTISSVVTSQLSVQVDGRAKFATFDIPLDADSFAIQVFQKGGEWIRFRLVSPNVMVISDPSGSQKVTNVSIPDKRFERLYPFTDFSSDETKTEYWMYIDSASNYTYGAIQVPIVPQQYDLRGKWRCELKYENRQPSVFLTVRKKPLSIATSKVTYVLPLHIALYCRPQNAARKLAYVKQALEAVKTIYAQVPLQIEYDEILTKNLDREYSDDFSSSSTAQLVRDNYREGKISVLVVEDLEVAQEAELGISGGIPGPQYLVHPRAATLVRLSNSYQSASIDRFARVIGHELGHYLGLTHQSCEYGLPPGLSEEERIQRASTRMMFYSNFRAGTQIAPVQKLIMRHAPIVQMRVPETPAPKTPITKLKVTITTGWGIPRFMDGAGTNMDVAFVLKTADSQRSQSWSLDTLGDNFEAGSTNTFTFTDCRLFVEDLNQWVISVYDTNWTRDWGGDAWHFKGITIEVNDRVVHSSQPNMFLGAGYSRIYQAALTTS